MIMVQLDLEKAYDHVNWFFGSSQDALSFLEWPPSSDREICNFLQNELLVSSRVLYWHGKEVETLGGLMVTRWYTLVTCHYKYIVSSCNDIIILAIT